MNEEEKVLTFYNDDGSIQTIVRDPFGPMKELERLKELGTPYETMTDEEREAYHEQRRAELETEKKAKEAMSAGITLELMQKIMLGSGRQQMNNRRGAPIDPLAKARAAKEKQKRKLAKASRKKNRK